MAERSIDLVAAEDAGGSLAQLEADLTSIQETTDEVHAGLTDAQRIPRFEDLERRAQQQAIDHANDEHVLRTKYARWIVLLLASQLVIMNTIFMMHAWLGYGWRIESSVVISYLAGTFGEIAVIAGVVTRYLFRDRVRPI